MLSAKRTPPCNLKDLTWTGKRGKTFGGSDMEPRSVGWNHPSQLGRVRPEGPGGRGREVSFGVRAQGGRELAQSGNSIKLTKADCGELGGRGRGNGWAVGGVKHAGHSESRTRISLFFWTLMIYFTVVLCLKNNLKGKVQKWFTMQLRFL